MGGRGASSGAGGGGGSPLPPPQPQQQPTQTPLQRTRNLSGQYAQNKRNKNGERLEGVYKPGYDNNGNAQVQKWQGQDENKAARFLAKIHNDLSLQNYDPNTQTYGSVVDTINGTTHQNGYGFYEGDYQKFSLAMGMNAKAQVIPDAQFQQLVKQNGLQVVYRGDTGDSQIDRFMNSDLSHTGVGSYGDGFYFSDSYNTANDYAASKAVRATGNRGDGRVLQMALSPTARVISYTQLEREMQKAGANFSSRLWKAGYSARGTYLNEGQAQFALKLGYNVVAGCGYRGSDYHYALTRDAFIVSDKVLKAK